MVQCNATGHSGVSSYYGAYRPDLYARQCFHAAVVYGCFKFICMLIMTSGLMLTYEAYVSLGRIEEFLLLENLLEASESGKSNEAQ